MLLSVRSGLQGIESHDTQRVKELLATGANPNVKKGDETPYELARYVSDEIKCAGIEVFNIYSK